MIKRCLLIIICLIGFSIQKVSAQANITLSIDSIVALEPLIMNDTTDFQVRVRVDSLGFPSSIFGDIYYHYLTDSMMNAGDTIGRVIGQDFFPELIVDGFIDVVNVDIQPDEIRTSPPMNLIVIWPAMIHPSIADSDSITIYLALEGFKGVDPIPNQTKGNIIYPCPAMTFLFIKPDEIDHIREMMITNMLGQPIINVPGANLSGGWINIDSLNSGSYIAIMHYNDGSIATMKFLKK